MNAERRTKLRSTLAAGIAAVKFLVGYIYPPTKAKLHRLFHGVLVIVAAGGSIAVWIQGQKWGWSTWNQIEAQSVVLGALLARASSAVKKLDAIVDKLPIPADETKPAEEAPKP